MFDKIYQPYEVLFKAGDPAKVLIEVHKGQVLCLKNFNQRLIPVFLASAGDSVGENAMIANSTYSYHAIALQATEVSHIVAQVFHRDLAQSPGWLGELLTTMVKRYEHTTNLITENRVISFEDVFNDQLEIMFKRILGATK